MFRWLFKDAVDRGVKRGVDQAVKEFTASPEFGKKLDGIVMLDNGELLVSSWAGSAVYRGKPGGEWKAAVENIKSPADIGWDAKRKRLLIPSFMGNSVTLNPLE